MRDKTKRKYLRFPLILITCLSGNPTPFSAVHAYSPPSCLVNKLSKQVHKFGGFFTHENYKKFAGQIYGSTLGSRSYTGFDFYAWMGIRKQFSLATNYIFKTLSYS